MAQSDTVAAGARPPSSVRDGTAAEAAERSLIPTEKVTVTKASIFIQSSKKVVFMQLYSASSLNVQMSISYLYEEKT